MSVIINVVGTVATAPRLLKSENKAAFCSFRVASNDRRFDRSTNQWIDGETNWFTVNLFRTLAEHAQESFTKGDRVIIQGRLRIKSWERDSKSGTSVEIDADAIGHELRWGVTSFTKRLAGEASSEAIPHTDTPCPESDNGLATVSDRPSSWSHEPTAESSTPSTDGFIPELAAA